jgi:pectate lyase
MAGPAARAADVPTTDRSPHSTAGSMSAAAGAAVEKVVGYGRGTVGGAGGSRRVVTNLKDSGRGSLRAALEGKGRRRVYFRVGGTIHLKSEIKIKHPYITVVGGSADRPGITIRGEAIVIGTHDVILRNLRLRPGDRGSSPSDTDALTISGGQRPVRNVVIDHVTMLWGPDIGGLAILGDVSHVTVQNSIMGMGLYLSRHPEGTRRNGGHSTAVNVAQMDRGEPSPRRITFWHNLFTTSDTRMPRLQGAKCVDVVNNVIFNWGTHPASGNPRTLNLVGNWYRRGPRTERFSMWVSQTSGVAPRLFVDSIYQRGNATDGFARRRGGASRVFAGSPRCGKLSVARQPASEAYAAVRASAGATLPVRDSIDRRVMRNLADRLGRYFNGAGYPRPNPYWP